MIRTGARARARARARRLRRLPRSPLQAPVGNVDVHVEVAAEEALLQRAGEGAKFVTGGVIRGREESKLAGATRLTAGDEVASDAVASRERCLRSARSRPRGRRARGESGLGELAMVRDDPLGKGARRLAVLLEEDDELARAGSEARWDAGPASTMSRERLSRAARVAGAVGVDGAAGHSNFLGGRAFAGAGPGLGRRSKRQNRAKSGGTPVRPRTPVQSVPTHRTLRSKTRWQAFGSGFAMLAPRRGWHPGCSPSRSGSEKFALRSTNRRKQHGQSSSEFDERSDRARRAPAATREGGNAAGRGAGEPG